MKPENVNARVEQAAMREKHIERFSGKALDFQPDDHDAAVEAREARREQNLAHRPADKMPGVDIGKKKATKL